MKKILLILALALGVKVNAQIVGGYLPVNSTKSATMGGLRVNGNETVTGTFSVGSTATITGALKASSTMSLGSANLTGGNTGTVAVLSDAIFNVFCFAASSNIADATTYYFGNSGYNLIGSTSNGNITLQNNCTLIGWDLNAVTSGVNSTTETATISISGATNYTLTTSATYTSAYLNLSGTSLSQDFNSGDKILIKVLSPTFATNPTGVYHGITLWFRRRS